MSAGEAPAFVALGANLDDPEARVRQAFPALAGLPETRLLGASSLYRSAPLGVGEQPPYINAVALLATRLSPASLLAALLALEQAAGRIRSHPGAPRTLDLDLLLYGEAQLALPGLVVPHPRLHLRAFVLRPLCEIAPQQTIPGRGRAAAWLPAVALQAIERLPAGA
jgi:2-amino-4-hydroxy-6-hydroxymethyldihydropteridine diphosphokinase